MNPASLIRRSFLYLILLAVCTTRADLQSDISIAIQNAKLGKTQVAVCVMDLASGKRITSINANASMIPASNMKLVTTSGALNILRPDFVFRTQLRLEKNTSRGDVLWVVGDGDPAFGDPKLLEQIGLDTERFLQLLVHAAQRAGVRNISSLVIDDRVFDRQQVHPDWPERQLNAWYCAQVSGLNFQDNCLDVYASPSASGDLVNLKLVPNAPFLRVSNRAVPGKSNRLLISRKKNSNDLVAGGGVRSRMIEPINITLDDPAAFFGRVFAHRLQQAGVSVQKIRRPTKNDSNPPKVVLYTVQTPLLAVLKRCNKDSQNLFAESLLKRTGSVFDRGSGSWKNGTAALRVAMQKLIGAEAKKITISDGSGMSRNNRVSASALSTLLAVMARDRELGPTYVDSLSIAGVDGTLKKRLKGDLSGRVRGKTGYVAGVSTFSGYLFLNQADASSKPAITFSLLFNNIPSTVPLRQVKSLQDGIVQLMDRHLSHHVAAR